MMEESQKQNQQMIKVMEEAEKRQKDQMEQAQQQWHKQMEKRELAEKQRNVMEITTSTVGFLGPLLGKIGGALFGPAGATKSKKVMGKSSGKSKPK